MLAWRNLVPVLLAATVLSAVAPVAHAQMPPDQRRQMRQEMREQWRAVPPDERHRLHEERSERWQQMPPEDRQRMREGNRERWQPMPPEDRQRMRDEMRARRGEGGGYGPPGGRRGRP